MQKSFLFLSFIEVRESARWSDSVMREEQSGAMPKSACRRTPAGPRSSLQCSGGRRRPFAGPDVRSRPLGLKDSPVSRVARGRAHRDCSGAFSVKRLFWVCCQFFVRRCPGKASMFSRRQSCRGKSQSPVVRIAEEMETEPSKPIDKISRGEITSHRAVSKENALWPRKK